METGVGVSDREKVISITNRREAIKTACMMAMPGDIILVAGKEDMKTIRKLTGLKIPFFDDKEIIREIFGIG